MTLKNDHIEALNYCAHAMEHIRANACLLAQLMRRLARVLNQVFTLPQHGVKFILPNCCNLVAPGELRRPEFYERAIATYVSRAKADAQIIVDASDEVQALIQACSVINCANVTTAERYAPSALNRKRRASGKQPFFTYKVLALSDERHVPGKPGTTGQHASPRMHLRRGHLRQLEHKVVWVRPALINAESTRGVVHKDYRVTGQDNDRRFKDK